MVTPAITFSDPKEVRALGGQVLQHLQDFESTLGSQELSASDFIYSVNLLLLFLSEHL
jgi:hypothetical protein